MSLIEDTFKTSFPLPASSFPPIPNRSTINTCPLVEIFPPTSLPALPDLPQRTSTDDLDYLPAFGLKHSTHIFPASYLRSSKPPATKLPSAPPSDASKETRNRINKETTETILEIREDHEREVRSWTIEDGLPQGYASPIVWNVASRFVNTKAPKGGLTLIFAAAIGFNKETWEPLIKQLWLSPTASLISEIWCFEFVTHGDAGLLNREALKASGIGSLMLLQLASIFLTLVQRLGQMMLVTFSILCCTSSHQILETNYLFISNESQSQSLPSAKSMDFKGKDPSCQLETRGVGRARESSSLYLYRLFVRASYRTLAAVHYPALFSSLVLLDPFVVAPLRSTKDVAQLYRDWAIGSLARRSSWKNRSVSCTSPALLHINEMDAREFALQTLQRSLPFKAWDPDVLKAYVNHGTYTVLPSASSSSEAECQLKLEPVQEASMYTIYYTPQAMWKIIPTLAPEIELFWIMPGMGMPLYVLSTARPFLSKLLC